MRRLLCLALVFCTAIPAHADLFGIFPKTAGNEVVFKNFSSPTTKTTPENIPIPESGSDVTGNATSIFVTNDGLQAFVAHKGVDVAGSERSGEGISYINLTNRNVRSSRFDTTNDNTIDSTPGRVALREGSLVIWVTLPETNKIVSWNWASNAMGTAVDVGIRPESIVVLSSGEVVTVGGTNKLVSLPPGGSSTSIVTTDLASPPSPPATSVTPVDIALSPDGNTLYVVASGSNELLVLDAKTKALQNRIDTGTSSPERIRLSMDGSIALVSHDGGIVQAIRLNDESPLQTWNGLGDVTGLDRTLNADSFKAFDATTGDVYTLTSTSADKPNEATETGLVADGKFLFGSPIDLPTEFTAMEDDDQITLSWKDNAADETSYRLVRTEENGTATTTNLPAGSSGYRDTAVQAETVYTYTLTARNAESQSTPLTLTARTSGESSVSCFVNSLR